jgi:hypothetical protein
MAVVETYNAARNSLIAHRILAWAKRWFAGDTLTCYALLRAVAENIVPAVACILTSSAEVIFLIARRSRTTAGITGQIASAIRAQGFTGAE